MAIKKLAYKFNPEKLTGEELSPGSKRAAREEIARAVHDYILDYVGQGKSPVSGESWKKSISKEYKEKKSEESSVSYANMELTGAMLDALEVVVLGDSIEVRIEGDQAPKADGHNNFSGDSKLPQRRFIPNPKEGQTFKKEIVKEIASIIKDYKDGG